MPARESESMKKKPKGHEIPIDSILDSVADGVFTITRDRVVTSFNRAAEKITGISRTQAIGRECFDVFRANICQTSCALERTILTGKQSIDVPVNIVNSRGERIPISISTAVLRDGKGKMVGGVETFRDLSAIEELKKEITQKYTFEDIISKNHKIQEIFNVLPDIAESESTVLIQGASGSGKELFARAIHNLSFRKDGPYVVVNCAALPDTLLESELFGYVTGAFTDAKKDKPGRFALAEGGTVFLDEVAELPTALQVKLLRVLQEKEFEPLGSTQPVKANVRIIAATNRDLKSLLPKGHFREDLYYRLNVIRIELPPLSERREDIPLLIEHFLRQFNLKKGKNITGVSEDVLDLLMRHDFPGNVRELENIIEHAYVLCRQSRISVEHLPPEFTKALERRHPRTKRGENKIRDAEARVIMDTLEKHGGNRSKAATELGMNRTTLWRKMKKHGITDHGAYGGSPK
jgi:PAS domain S-box-containing protein